MELAALTPETRRVLRAMTAMHNVLPGLVRDLGKGQISPHDQRRFAWLLLELAELLVQHANREEFGDDGYPRPRPPGAGDAAPNTGPPLPPP